MVNGAARARVRRVTKSAFLVAMSVFYVAAGLNHFRDPGFYLGIVPRWLPWPAGLVLASGIAEIALGVLVLPRTTRRLAGFGLVALLVAIFPANVQMAIDGHAGVPSWALWLRLPLQGVLIAWALVMTREGVGADTPARTR